MTRTIWTLVVMALLGAQLGGAQDVSARISGPVLGYVLDADAGGVRPVLGIPGAATLGPALELGSEIHQTAIAQQAGYLLAAAGPERQVTLYRNLGGDINATLVAEAPPGPERILLSSEGSAAALVYGEAGPVVVLTGLPDAPALSRTLEPAGMKVWAISDDGASLLVSGGASEAEAVYLLDAEGGLRFLLSTAGMSAGAFLVGSTEAVVADGTLSSVYWVREAGEVIPLAGEADGISDPAAVSVSRDNRRVFVANAGSGTVAALDLEGGPAALVSCECAPTGLERMQGNAVFRLTKLSGEPMWVFDGDGPEARVVFVPPAARAVSPAQPAEDLPQGGSQ